MTLGYGENTREYLLEPDVEAPQINPQCPEFDVRVNGIDVRALIDTGSQVSAVSEIFYKANFERLSQCPTLPLTAVTVTSATEKKATKVSRQFYAMIQLQQVSGACTLLVVPKLTVDCIIGIDFLYKLRTKLDLENYEITLSDPYNPTRTCQLQFANPPIAEENEKAIMRVVQSEWSEEIVTDIEIEEKVANTEWASVEQEAKFIELLKKYQRVFD